MVALLLVGLACADPQPAPVITPPPPVVAPSEAAAPPESSTETPGEAQAAPAPEADAIPGEVSRSAPEPEPEPLPWGLRFYFLLSDAIWHLAGFLFIEAHRDLGTVLLIDKITEAVMAILTAIGVVRVAVPRLNRGARPPGSEALLGDAAVKRIEASVAEANGRQVTLLQTQLTTALQQLHETQAQRAATEAMAASLLQQAIAHPGEPDGR